VAVRIRLKRMGRKNLPAYRIGVFDGRTRRDGPALEIVGWFNPLMNEVGKGFKCETDRIEEWIRRGAKMTLAVTELLDKQGVKLATPPAKPAKEPKPAKAAAKPAAKGAAPARKADPEAVARRKRKLAKRESRRAWKAKKVAAAAAKPAAAPAAGA
jgi:small subunit ribosomal protein S16